MITGAQIRAARALLKLSTAGLAQRCILLHNIILQAEAVDDIPVIGSSALMAIKTTLDDAGIEFVGSLGVRMAHDTDELTGDAR